MAKKWEWYTSETEELVAEYSKLRKDQLRLDGLARLEWKLPPALEALEYMRPVRITAPFDTIRAGTNVLSVLDESIDIDPIMVSKDRDSQGAKEKGEKWEETLKWQMDRAARRRSTLKEDITRSALMYDEICAQVVHLPSQIKSIKSIGGNPARQEAALRNGQFAISLKNPQTVYTRYSDYGPEAVLHASVMRPKAIVDFWGDKASTLRSLVEAEQAEDYYMLFDYVDFDGRAVWVVPGETLSDVSWDDKLTILKMDHGLNFLPWVCVVGGTNLSDRPENQRFPILWGAMKAEQTAIANIIATLTVGDAIATASQPKLAKKGPEPDSIEIDYTEPGGEINVPPGHEVEQLTQQTVNPALREIYERFISDLQRSTIPQILVTAEAAPGEPFSGYNLRIRQAISSLMPWKKLAERGEEGILRHMLYWCSESGVAIDGPKGYKINPSEIDMDHIYLGVTLTPYEPLDEQQKVNTAVMAARELKLPAADVLEMMNVSDAQRKIQNWMKEQFTWAELQGQLQKIQMTASGELEQMAAQMAQQMIQEQQAAMQQQGQQGGGPTAQQQPAPGAPPGIEGVGGQGFNPNAGGEPPALANPAGNVREQQTGTTRLGEQNV